MRFKTPIFWLIFLLAATLSNASAEPEKTNMPLDNLRITTHAGQTIDLQVSFAISPEQQQRGLMYVEEMPANYGMVFLMQPPRQAHFWMRNTRLPLDMIFIAPGGRIARIVTRYDTNSDAVTSSQGLVSAVLEIAADGARQLGIQTGDQVSHKTVQF
jgi:uncharacterized protein